jgi:hypothetical protein
LQDLNLLVSVAKRVAWIAIESLVSTYSHFEDSTAVQRYNAAFLNLLFDLP